VYPDGVIDLYADWYLCLVLNKDELVRGVPFHEFLTHFAAEFYREA